MARRAIKLVAVSEETARRLEALAEAMGVRVNELVEIVLRLSLNLLGDGSSVRAFTAASIVASNAARLGLTPVPLEALNSLTSSLSEEAAERLALEAGRAAAILAAAAKLSSRHVNLEDLVKAFVPGIDVRVEELGNGGRVVATSRYLALRPIRLYVKTVAETTVLTLGYRVVESLEDEGLVVIRYARG